jgi:multidrug resistance efflux pump
MKSISISSGKLWSRGKLWTKGLPLALIILGGGSGLFLLKALADTVLIVRINEAQLAVATGPVVPLTEPVIAREHGRLGKVFIREGSSVMAGQSLFSLHRDPKIDQDLVDRAVARDLAEVNWKIRDANQAVQSLSERIAVSKQAYNSFLNQQINLAQSRLGRREELWRQGGISREIVEEGEERMLRLKTTKLEQERDIQRVMELQRLKQSQLKLIKQLTIDQTRLQKQNQARQAQGRIHPATTVSEKSIVDYATYRSPGSAILLRLLKRPGEIVHSHESIAILQRISPAPDVIATITEDQASLLTIGQDATVEIPSLREYFSAKLISLNPSIDGKLKLRMSLAGLEPEEIRRLQTLPGEPVRIVINKQNAITSWMGLRKQTLMP